MDIRIVRSARRKKTVSAKLLNWYTLEVRAPADIPEEELERIVRDLEQRTLERIKRHRHFASDEDLDRRAQRLNKELFNGVLRWRSIRFVSNQRARFGSCSPGRGTIRLSNRLLGVPDFVLDYVIVHELAHLLEPNHSKAFWDLVSRYELTERARGYLMALGLEEDTLNGG
ncbi:MAG: M48 family metallopeptidase [Chloroflexi bacterium]|nr:M48 family metallopeptidase [Chloroflexota bacterium]